MYNTGVEIPKVSFADLSYSGIPINSYFMGFDLDNAGKLSKLDNTGIVTVIEGGSGGGITLTNLSANAPLTYNNVNGAFSITKSTGSTSGYLSSTDWAMFNSKQGSLTLTTTGSSGAATLNGNTLNIPQYSGGAGGITLTSLSANAPITYNNTNGTFSINQSNGSTNGYLSSTDWAMFNSKIGVTTGTNNYIAKFTPNGNTIGNSIIQDNGTYVGVGYAGASTSKFAVQSNLSYAIIAQTTVSNSTAGQFFSNGSGAGTNTGLSIVASNATSGNIGIGVSVTNGSGDNIGIDVAVANGTNRYALSLKDGTQNVNGRFLKNIDAGKANWASITAADVSGVQGALTLTTTGSSGAATLTDNTLNIPQYSGGAGFVWPEHIQYSTVRKTLWATGNNTAVPDSTSYGLDALSTESTWFGNSAFGHQALKSANSGWCSAFGAKSLKNNTTGAKNSAFGADTLLYNETGSDNTAVGNAVLETNISGSFNTAVGAGALYMCKGDRNTALGSSAMGLLTTGTKNIGIGGGAASTLLTGNNNTAVGHSIWIEGSASNNTVLGYDAWAKTFDGCIILGSGAIATGSNQFVVGSSGVTAGLITTETITPTRTWKVKINGVDYKIPMVPA